MKTKTSIIMVIILLFAMASCQKDQDITPSFPNTETTTDDAEDLHLKISSSSILNASNASQIPSQMFTTYSYYKSSYQHLKQEYDPGYGKCSWTSYVIAAACIIKGNCSPCSYPVSYAKVNAVRAACIGNSTPAYGAQITRLRWYCQNYDYLRLACTLESKYPSQRFTAVKLMLSHLNSYHSPFLVISTMYTSQGAIGHYLIVHAIDWKVGGTGSSIYYTDCNTIASNSSYTSNLKSMSFTTFLDLMVAAPSNYNMLFLRPA